MQRGNTLPQLPLGADSDRAALEAAQSALGQIILGKDGQIELALACLLARGHLLIEDVPGVGKTRTSSASPSSARNRANSSSSPGRSSPN